MNQISNALSITLGRWEDPGSYPSGAGGGPLSGYDIIDEIAGSVLFQLTEEELAQIITGDQDLAGLVEIAAVLFSDDGRLAGTRITKWDGYVQGDKLRLEVADFDDQNWYPEGN